MSHTKEPWVVFEDDPKAIVTAANPMLSLMTVGDDGLATMFKEEDARRIVSCINACAGISTRELELMTGRMSIENQLKACDLLGKSAEEKATKRSKFAKQRDKLLEVLKECDEAMVYMSEYDIPLCLPERVKAAIANVEGSAA